LLQLCSDVQITILSFALQPPDLVETPRRDDFPFLKSVIPYVVPYSPLKVAKEEGILRVNRHFRTLGLEILFKDAAYAPVCLCVRWFHRLSYLNRYAPVAYRACAYERQILLSPFERTWEKPFLGISYWTRLVLPMKASRSSIDTEIQTLARLFSKMISLKSIHLVIILPLPQNGSDWDVLFRELCELKFLDHISFTIYCISSWYEDLRASVPTLTTPCGRVYVPVFNSNSVCFEGTNLSKGDGLGDFKCILGHMDEVHRQISSGKNGWPFSRVSRLEALAAE
jgi:hypothetical protein